MRTDVLLDENDDLMDDGNGDFATGESVQDEVNSLVTSLKGNWKEFAFAGFGIITRLRKRAGSTTVIDTMPKFMRDLKMELDNDGHKNSVISVSPDLSDFKIDV